MKNIFLVVLILGLAGSTLFLGLKLRESSAAMTSAQEKSDSIVFNAKVLDFTSMFIEEVLKAEQEVSFETRLALEAEVRALNDPEILKHWQAFTNSTTSDEAQGHVKNLLATLISKAKN